MVGKGDSESDAERERLLLGDRLNDREILEGDAADVEGERVKGNAWPEREALDAEGDAGGHDGGTARDLGGGGTGVERGKRWRAACAAKHVSTLTRTCETESA